MQICAFGKLDEKVGLKLYANLRRQLLQLHSFRISIGGDNVMAADTSKLVSTDLCPCCVDLFWVECRGRDDLCANEYLIHIMTALLRCKLSEGAALREPIRVRLQLLHMLSTTKPTTRSDFEKKTKKLILLAAAISLFMNNNIEMNEINRINNSFNTKDKKIRNSYRRIGFLQ